MFVDVCVSLCVCVRVIVDVCGCLFVCVCLWMYKKMNKDQDKLTLVFSRVAILLTLIGIAMNVNER